MLDVLVRVVVELARRHELPDHRRLRSLVAQHGALELPSVDRFLDHHLGIVGAGFGDPRGELSRCPHLADADRGAEVRGLDEAGEAELVPHPASERDGRFFPDARHQPAADRDASITEDRLHERLVHPDRRGEHPRSDVGDAGQLEEPLDRAVLAVRSVQDREHDVERLRGTAAVERHECAPRGVGGKGDLDAVFRYGLERGLRHLEQVQALGSGQPAPLLGDRNRDDLVARRIERPDDRCRRAQRHLVLARAPPVHHPHPHPRAHHSTMRKFPERFKSAGRMCSDTPGGREARRSR